jgi:hypothetical protein
MISSIVLAALGTPSLLFVMLLPALLELRKPKDAGPRLIMLDTVQALPAQPAKNTYLANLEEQYDLDNKLKPFVYAILSILPVLEN